MKQITPPPPKDKPRGYVKFMRGDALELIKANNNAFVLAAVIAYRARYSNSFNADGLQPGEALLGDFKAYGMTEQEYRTAKKQLTKWDFATFKPTNRGTLGRLLDTRLFDPLNLEVTDRATDGQRTGNGRVTTNKKDVRKIEEGGNSSPAELSPLPELPEALR